MKYFSDFIQKLIRSSAHHPQSIYLSFKAIAFIVFFRYFNDSISSIYFQRAITRKKGQNPDKKTICVFCHEEFMYEILKF